MYSLALDISHRSSLKIYYLNLSILLHFVFSISVTIYRDGFYGQRYLLYIGYGMLFAKNSISFVLFLSFTTVPSQYYLLIFTDSC